MTILIEYTTYIQIVLFMTILNLCLLSKTHNDLVSFSPDYCTPETVHKRDSGSIAIYVNDLWFFVGAK